MYMHLPSINLGSRKIQRRSSPYIIAEIGVNHEGSMEKAKLLIDLAKEGGADAAKFQSYKANTLASRNSPSYWDLTKENTKSQYELFKKYDSFNKDQYIELAEYCKTREIDFLSTPFDEDSLRFLSPIVPFFKVASADITNKPFLREVAKQNKPIVLSTGASTLGEIELSLEIINSINNVDVALLHCILNYPTPNKDANLGMISCLAKIYPNNIIGYSDHTLPDKNMNSLISAYLLGAVIIEKHFTNDKDLPGNDHYHSMDIVDLKNLKKIIKDIDELIGSEEIKKPIKSEAISRQNARRSIVLKKNFQKDHIISSDDITCKRPGEGISPIHWDNIIGMKLLKSLPSDHILKWSDISN